MLGTERQSSQSGVRVRVPAPRPPCCVTWGKSLTLFGGSLVAFGDLKGHFQF